MHWQQFLQGLEFAILPFDITLMTNRCRLVYLWFLYKLFIAFSSACVEYFSARLIRIKLCPLATILFLLTITDPCLWFMFDFDASSIAMWSIRRSCFWCILKPSMACSTIWNMHLLSFLKYNPHYNIASYNKHSQQTLHLFVACIEGITYLYMIHVLFLA